MDKGKKIKCNNVEYRKGFIEVIPNIHDGCINIETWDVHVDIDITNIELEDENFPEEGVTNNTEIEMNVNEAEELVRRLKVAIAKVKEANQDA